MGQVRQAVVLEPRLSALRSAVGISPCGTLCRASARVWAFVPACVGKWSQTPEKISLKPCRNVRFRV